MLIVDGVFGRYVIVGASPDPVAWVNGPERVTLPAPAVESVVTDLLAFIDRGGRCCGVAIYSKNQKHSGDCPVGAAKKMLDLVEFAEAVA